MEIGARGYLANSLDSCLRAVGLVSRPVRACVRESGNEALQTSFWVWILRDKASWRLKVKRKPNDPKGCPGNAAITCDGKQKPRPSLVSIVESPFEDSDQAYASSPGLGVAQQPAQEPARSSARSSVQKPTQEHVARRTQ